MFALQATTVVARGFAGLRQLFNHVAHFGKARCPGFDGTECFLLTEQFMESAPQFGRALADHGAVFGFGPRATVPSSLLMQLATTGKHDRLGELPDRCARGAMFVL